MDKYIQEDSLRAVSGLGTEIVPPLVPPILNPWLGICF